MSKKYMIQVNKMNVCVVDEQALHSAHDVLNIFRRLRMTFSDCELNIKDYEFHLCTETDKEVMKLIHYCTSTYVDCAFELYYKACANSEHVYL